MSASGIGGFSGFIGDWPFDDGEAWASNDEGWVDEFGSLSCAAAPERASPADSGIVTPTLRSGFIPQAKPPSGDDSPIQRLSLELLIQIIGSLDRRDVQSLACTSRWGSKVAGEAREYFYIGQPAEALEGLFLKGPHIAPINIDSFLSVFGQGLAAMPQALAKAINEQWRRYPQLESRVTNFFSDNPIPPGTLLMGNLRGKDFFRKLFINQVRSGIRRVDERVFAARAGYAANDLRLRRILSMLTIDTEFCLSDQADERDYFELAGDGVLAWEMARPIFEEGIRDFVAEMSRNQRISYIGIGEIALPGTPLREFQDHLTAFALDLMAEARWGYIFFNRQSAERLL